MTLRYDIDDSLTLRQVQPRYAAEVYALIDANREHLLRWLSWPTLCNSVADSEAYAQQTLADFEARKQLSMHVVENEKIIGGIGWTDWKQGPEMGAEYASADIGYWLAADATGRGVMTRRVRRLLDAAFEEFDLHRITIRCEIGNTASAAIPRRLHFTHEGTLRHVCCYADRWVDHDLFSMLADQWEVKRPSHPET